MWVCFKFKKKNNKERKNERKNRLLSVAGLMQRWSKSVCVREMCQSLRVHLTAIIRGGSGAQADGRRGPGAREPRSPWDGAAEPRGRAAAGPRRRGPGSSEGGKRRVGPKIRQMSLASSDVRAAAGLIPNSRIIRKPKWVNNGSISCGLMAINCPPDQRPFRWGGKEKKKPEKKSGSRKVYHSLILFRLIVAVGCRQMRLIGTV